LEKKILFCPIPKAGSSNWKRIFAKLTTENYDEVDDLLEIRKVHHIQLPVLSDFSLEKQKRILDEFSEYKRITQRDSLREEMLNRTKIIATYLLVRDS